LSCISSCFVGWLLTLLLIWPVLSVHATTAFDAVNRPVTVNWSPVQAQAPPPALGVTFGHGYDATNRRISQTVSDNSWLVYPGAAGTTAYSVNSLNQYTAVGSVTPTYDANGNLTSDGTYTYGYDLENRLISVSGAGQTAAYAYDGMGHRKSRTVNGVTTLLVGDGTGPDDLEYDGITVTELR
jgi:YD repeat-containing protein